jgi:hypothetical protein
MLEEQLPERQKMEQRATPCSLLAAGRWPPKVQANGISLTAMFEQPDACAGLFTRSLNIISLFSSFFGSFFQPLS